MLVITQLVYVRPGHEAEFHEFEERVLPLLRQHRGELLLRLRPSADALVAGSLSCPYEVHLVRFEDEAGLRSYADDPERQRYLELKSASVESALTFTSPG